MDELVVSTVVYLPAEEAYDFLIDFSRYASYSKHLRDVEQRRGDGGPGTRYAMQFAWWKLTYTVESEVTAVDPPERIDWRIVRNLDAHGRWRVEELDEPPADAPDDVEVASRIEFEVAYDADSANEGLLDLPRFVSMGWVINRLKPAIESEAERIVERVVEDIEGQRRPVDLTIEQRS